MELLRMVCMFFIVFHHFVQAMYTYISGYGLESRMTSTAPMLLTFLGTFALVGVNVFVLISGYYSIRPSWRNFWSFYLQVGFYAGLFYWFHMIIDGVTFNRWLILNTLFPISHNQGLWFVPTYFALYLLSPLLNMAIDKMSRKELLLAVLLLTIVNVWLGFFNQLGMNSTGYNLMQFVFLYVIGRYVRMLVDVRMNKKCFRGGYSCMLSAV